MKKFQRRRFRIINPSLVAIAKQETPPLPRIWDERTKGSSKDSDHAINLLWLLGIATRTLRIQVGAYDQGQADEIRQICKSILRLDAPVNNLLAQFIEVQQTKIINTRTESVAEILTSDKLGSHGSRPDVVLVNELTHQKDKGFAETLLDNADKMPNSLVVIATNSGHNPSWQLGWKRSFALSERWTILEYGKPAPWIAEEALVDAERRSSQGRFQRLWHGIWGSDTGSAIDKSDIENSITQTQSMTGKEKGFAFYAGMDIGLRKHASGLTVVAKHVGYSEEKSKPKRQLSSLQQAMVDIGEWEEPEEEYEYNIVEPTHRLRLAFSQSWKPKAGKRVSLEAIKTAIQNAHQRFNLAGISLDPHQGEHLIELLERENVPIIRTPQTLSSLQNQATALIEAFQQRNIDLYNEVDLLADLKRLQIKDSGLKVRLVSPEVNEDEGTAHGDLASALSFAIALAKIRNHLPILNPSDRMIAWP